MTSPLPVDVTPMADPKNHDSAVNLGRRFAALGDLIDHPIVTNSNSSETIGRHKVPGSGRIWIIPESLDGPIDPNQEIPRPAEAFEVSLGRRRELDLPGH